jgi:hypothetical protein
MPGMPFESEDHMPQIDPETVAEIDGAAYSWLHENSAISPEEALMNEFSDYFRRLGDIHVTSLGISKYDIRFDNGVSSSLWPRAETPLGSMFDMFTVSTEGLPIIRPTVIIGSLVTKTNIEDISDEVRLRITHQCLACAVNGFEQPMALGDLGFPAILTPRLCDEAYLVRLTAYSSVSDHVNELENMKNEGMGNIQPMWRTTAINSQGKEEHFLVGASVTFSGARLANARVTLPDGTVDDTHLNIYGQEE